MVGEGGVGGGVFFYCCFTSTEAIRTIRDGKREFKVNMILNVHRNHKAY